MAAGAAVLAIIAQHKGGGLAVMNEFTLGERVSNALVSVLVYIYRAFWPQNLAVFYPFPIQIPLIQVLASLGIIAAITLLCFRFRHKLPLSHRGVVMVCRHIAAGIGYFKGRWFCQCGSIYLHTAHRTVYHGVLGLVGHVETVSASTILSAGMIGLVAVGLFFNTTLQLQNWSDSYCTFYPCGKGYPENDFAHHSLGHIYAAKRRFWSSCRLILNRP